MHAVRVRAGILAHLVLQQIPEQEDDILSEQLRTVVDEVLHNQLGGLGHGQGPHRVISLLGPQDAGGDADGEVIGGHHVLFVVLVYVV